METQLSQPVIRAELFQASHTTLARSFVNKERHNHKDLVICSQSSSKNEAFSSFFIKEYPMYVRGMGFGVIPTQMYGSSSSSSSRHDDGMVTATEHNTLKNMVQRLTQQLEEAQQHVAFLMSRENQNVTPNQENVGSPVVGRHSSHGVWKNEFKKDDDVLMIKSVGRTQINEQSSTSHFVFTL